MSSQRRSGVTEPTLPGTAATAKRGRTGVKSAAPSKEAKKRTPKKSAPAELTPPAPAPEQPKLPGMSPRARVGVLERAVGADLTELRQLELLPPGATALQNLYRTLAREVDRAERERDRYGKIHAGRELMRVRLALAPTTIGAETFDLDEFVAGLPTP